MTVNLKQPYKAVQQTHCNPFTLPLYDITISYFPFLETLTALPHPIFQLINLLASLKKTNHRLLPHLSIYQQVHQFTLTRYPTLVSAPLKPSPPFLPQIPNAFTHSRTTPAMFSLSQIINFPLSTKLVLFTYKPPIIYSQKKNLS